jgi:predicted RNA binding protein YcfA (HicA-like mRNA interferase family)
MPKYSQIKGKELIEIFKKYWFVEHNWKWSHCTMKNLDTQKRTTIPVHNKPIWKWLLTAILKQSWLDKKILETKSN